MLTHPHNATTSILVLQSVNAMLNILCHSLGNWTKSMGSGAMATSLDVKQGRFWLLTIQHYDQLKWLFRNMEWWRGYHMIRIWERWNQMYANRKAFQFPRLNIWIYHDPRSSLNLMSIRCQSISKIIQEAL